MSIYRINPELLKSNGASDGDVLTYVSANARIEWSAPTGGGGGDVANAWVNANDYNTYTTLQGNIDAVQDNIASIASGGGVLTSDQFTIDGTTNVFTLSQNASSAAGILVSLSGLVQFPEDDYIVSGNTLTLANTTPLAANVGLEVRHIPLSNTGGGGGEGITTGKAIAMAIVFG